MQSVGKSYHNDTGSANTDRTVYRTRAVREMSTPQLVNLKDTATARVRIPSRFRLSPAT